MKTFVPAFEEADSPTAERERIEKPWNKLRLKQVLQISIPMSGRFNVPGFTALKKPLHPSPLRSNYLRRPGLTDERPILTDCSRKSPVSTPAISAEESPVPLPASSFAEILSVVPPVSPWPPLKSAYVWVSKMVIDERAGAGCCNTAEQRRLCHAVFSCELDSVYGKKATEIQNVNLL